MAPEKWWLPDDSFLFGLLGPIFRGKLAVREGTFWWIDAVHLESQGFFGPCFSWFFVCNKNTTKTNHEHIMNNFLPLFIEMFITWDVSHPIQDAIITAIDDMTFLFKVRIEPKPSHSISILGGVTRNIFFLVLLIGEKETELENLRKKTTVHQNAFCAIRVMSLIIKVVLLLLFQESQWLLFHIFKKQRLISIHNPD